MKPRHSCLFKPGDIVLLVQLDGNKKYVVRLEEKGVYMTVAGFIKASDIIGKPPGSIVSSSNGSKFAVLPTTIVEEMETYERKSQIIYPKDLAIITALIGAGPCMRMLQSGVGTGYSLGFFARLAGDCGSVIGVEIREDMAKTARKNMTKLGYLNTEIIQGNIEEIDLGTNIFDAGLLDLPNPIKALENIWHSIKPGGRVAVYLPTISQVERLKSQLERNGKYMWLGSYEAWLREWIVKTGKTRPSNVPASHTGFIVVLARLV
jgi:tRNA (adenine57-N1/adenine58-N1)-methyltransferase